MLTAGAITHVLREEPQFAATTDDASWYTPVKVAEQNWCLLLHSGLSKREKMLVCIMHVYLCMHIVLVSQCALVPSPRSPSKLQAS